MNGRRPRKGTFTTSGLCILVAASVMAVGCTRSLRMSYRDLDLHGKAGKTAGLVSTPAVMAADVAFYPVQLLTLPLGRVNIWPVKPGTDEISGGELGYIDEHYRLPGHTVEALFYYAAAGVTYPVNFIIKDVPRKIHLALMSRDERIAYYIRKMHSLTENEYRWLVEATGRAYAPPYFPAYAKHGDFAYHFGAKQRLFAPDATQAEWAAWLAAGRPAGPAEELRFVLVQASKSEYGFPDYWQALLHRKQTEPPFLLPRDEASIYVLVDSFSYTRGHVSRMVFDTLLRLGQAAIPPLVAGLASDHAEVRRKSAEILPNVNEMDRNPAVVPALLVCLKDSEPTVRLAAVRALGQIGTPSAVSGLEAAYDDEKPEIRRAIIASLGQLADHGCLKTMAKAIEDPVTGVRMLAVKVLQQWGSDGTELLVAALSDRNIQVRNSAANALGHVNDPRAVDALIALLDDRDTGGSAAFALGAYSDHRMIAPLLKALKSGNSTVRYSAAYALDFTDDPRVMAALERALSDPDRRVRSAAQKSLETIKKKTPATQR